jgi:nucleotide-binding universal stress UspA family protein
MYAHLLVALDGSENAERILPHVEALAERFGSRVTLVQVTTAAEAIMASTASSATLGGATPIVDPFPIAEAETSAAAEYLEGVAGRLRARLPRVEVETPDGPPADTLVARARELGADLIAMTTHGRTGLGRVLLGSTAESVLHHAPCPLLLLRIEQQPKKP